MKISSVRLGHANNSSSTHSILLNSTGKAVEPQHGDFQYGWDWFHLKDRESKKKYLATLVYSALLNGGMSSEHAGIIARDLTAYDPYAEEPDAYVDHQSVFVFPRRFNERYVDHEFMKDFVAYIRDNDDISIRGGNDNEEDPVFGPKPPLHWMPDEEELVLGELLPVNGIPSDQRDLPLFCRRDKGWWILYNQESGAKIRLSFEKNPAPYVAASTAELVDIKLTDYCGYGCTFCYQDSTKAGKHAKLNDITVLAYKMSHAKVFEVALGGGETTEHPEFAKILQVFSGVGVTPNFTTFNMKWAKDPEKREAVERHCKSFAVSSPMALKELVAWDDEHQQHGPKGTFQLAMGCHDEKTVKDALDKAAKEGVSVTLLGFKDHGRGVGFKVHDYGYILDYIMDTAKWVRFGADSVFVEQFGSEMKRRGISEKLMVNREGAFSCYIDAVAMTMGASSYTKELHPAVDMVDIFKKFPYVS